MCRGCPNDNQRIPCKPSNPLLVGQAPQSVSEYMRGYLQRIRAGDIGPLPIIIGLILISIIFQSQNANFLTPKNIVNLVLQMAVYTTISYGLVFVLLLG